MNVKRLIIWSIVGTGISSIAVQLVTIREFLSQFHGNEITIALVLFCWLLITGLGSLCARPIKKGSLILFALLSLVTALFPFVQILLIRGFRDAIFIHGAAPGFYQILGYIAATTTFYCLLVGFLLPYTLKVLESCDYPFTSGQLYITDSIGDISGAVLFSFFLVYWLKPFKAVAFSSAFLILVALLLLLKTRKKFLLLPAILAVVLFCAFAMNSRFEISTLQGQYGEIMKYVESPYGRIVITREGSQHTFWESGVPFYSDANTIRSEEKTHYPLGQLREVDRVLLISGGLGESLSETLKHHPGHIDYVELDPHLTNTAAELGFIKENPRVTIMNTDGRRYIKETEKKYDAVIIDLPDPDTFQINRFFTSEFFALTKKILTPGGILSFGLEYSPNYISRVRQKKLSTIYNTVRNHFRNVKVIPGGKAYYLCRDGVLGTDIPALLREKSVNTSYIEGFYPGNVTLERIGKIQEILDKKEFINRDFEPRVINILFEEWFLKHGASPKAFFLAILALAFIYLAFLRKEEYVLFTTGLSTMGVEMLIIFTFQVLYGYIYLKIGAVIAVFLLGILPGAMVANYQRDRGMVNLVASEIILLSLLLLFFVWVKFFKGELHQGYFLAYGFIFSFFCGYQFPAATEVIGEERSPAAGCLAADLTGAALGTLLTGALLIPLLGIESAIIFLILVKISSNIVVFYVRGKRG
ncbi:spermidine synthase [Thermodesulfobacteriota bacterium]